MIFLQPFMLWALPAALLPLAVHLLNRLRHRAVRWAAIMFLVAATRSSTRRARLRHYLILACRILAMLCILLAMSRPLTGGWLGAALGRNPETLIVLLDRSASMETLLPGRNAGRRAQALELLARHPFTAGNRPAHCVLIESARREPLEIAALAGLPEMELAQATDTAADLPAMFRAALDYLVAHQPGRSEIWVVSDGQAANWRADSREWRSVSARLAALPRPPRVQILDCSGGGTDNVSVSLAGLELLPASAGAAERQLRLAVDLRAARPPRAPFPMIVTINGVRAQVEIHMPGAEFRYHGIFAVPADRPEGQGAIAIPADDNPRDNCAYFVYAEPQPARAAVLAADEHCARVLQAAAAPDPRRVGHTAERLEPDGLARVAWSELDLLAWQGPAPEAAPAAALRDFAAAGGAILCLPPGENGGPGLCGLAWNPVETARDEPWRPADWHEQDGPLARTADGASLPLAGLEIRRRQIAAADPDRADNPAWTVLASLDDGGILLQAGRIGSGLVVQLATLPRDDWSNLEEGTVLVPMIQRLLQAGHARRQPARLAACGEWQPAGDDGDWRAVEPSESGQPACHAGIYALAGRRLALNIPPAELRPETMAAEQAAELLAGLEVGIARDVLYQRPGQAENELWPLLIYAALAAMLLETLLASSARLVPSAAAPAVRPFR